MDGPQGLCTRETIEVLRDGSQHYEITKAEGNRRKRGYNRRRGQVILRVVANNDGSFQKRTIER